MQVKYRANRKFRVCDFAVWGFAVKDLKATVVVSCLRLLLRFGVLSPANFFVLFNAGYPDLTL